MSQEPASQGPLPRALALVLALLLLGGVLYLFGGESTEPQPAARAPLASPRAAASVPEPAPPPTLSTPLEAPLVEEAQASSSPSPTPPEASEEDWEFTEEGAVVHWIGGDEDEEAAPGPRLEGHVYAPDRRPLPGASLVLYRLGPKALDQIGTEDRLATLAALPPDTLRTLLNTAKSSADESGQEGEFSLSLPPGAPGEPYLLRVEHHDQTAVISQAFATLPLEPLEIVLPEPGELRIEFELAKGAELAEEPSVWVWAPGGWAGSSSVAGIEFRYPFSSHVDSASSRARRARGVFYGGGSEESISLEPRRLRSIGVVEVVVRTRGCATFRRRVELEPGLSQRLVVPLNPLASITGQVVDETGRPLAGVGLLARGPQGGPLTQSDEEGRFKLELDEAQTYTLSYLDPGRGHSVDVAEASPGDEVRVEVDRSKRGTLQVLDVYTRARAANLWLEAEGGERIRLGYTGAWSWGRSSGPRGFGRSADLWRSQLEARGRLLTSAELPPGDYVLRGHSEGGFVSAAGVPFTIRAGETTKVRAGLTPGTGVNLLVHAGGKALTQGSVSRLGAYEGTDLDSEGRATLSGVDPAGEVFVVRSAGFAPKRVTLGREGVLRVELNAGVSLSGVVRDAQGAPLPGARLNISTEGGRSLDAISDHKGRYLRPFLEPGQTYEVELFVPYQRTSLGQVALPPEPGEHRHDLTLPR